MPSSNEDESLDAKFLNNEPKPGRRFRDDTVKAEEVAEEATQSEPEKEGSGSRFRDYPKFDTGGSRFRDPLPEEEQVEPIAEPEPSAQTPIFVRDAKSWPDVDRRGNDRRAGSGDRRQGDRRELRSHEPEMPASEAPLAPIADTSIDPLAPITPPIESQPPVGEPAVSGEWFDFSLFDNVDKSPAIPAAPADEATEESVAEVDVDPTPRSNSFPDWFERDPFDANDLPWATDDDNDDNDDSDEVDASVEAQMPADGSELIDEDEDEYDAFDVEPLRVELYEVEPLEIEDTVGDLGHDDPIPSNDLDAMFPSPWDTTSKARTSPVDPARVESETPLRMPAESPDPWSDWTFDDNQPAVPDAVNAPEDDWWKEPEADFLASSPPPMPPPSPPQNERSMAGMDDLSQAWWSEQEPMAPQQRQPGPNDERSRPQRQQPTDPFEDDDFFAPSHRQPADFFDEDADYDNFDNYGSFDDFDNPSPPRRTQSREPREREQQWGQRQRGSRPASRRRPPPKSNFQMSNLLQDRSKVTVIVAVILVIILVSLITKDLFARVAAAPGSLAQACASLQVDSSKHVSSSSSSSSSIVSAPTGWTTLSDLEASTGPVDFSQALSLEPDALSAVAILDSSRFQRGQSRVFSSADGVSARVAILEFAGVPCAANFVEIHKESKSIVRSFEVPGVPGAAGEVRKTDNSAVYIVRIAKDNEVVTITWSGDSSATHAVAGLIELAQRQTAAL